MTDAAVEDMIRSTAEKLFAEAPPPMEACGEACVFDRHLWSRASEVGFPAALADEAQGGLGLTAAQAFAAIRVAAARAVSLPLGETVLVNWLLGLAGLPIEAGPCGINLPSDKATGEAVPYGRALCLVIVVEPTGQGATFALYRPQAADWTPGVNIADEPRDVLSAVPEVFEATGVLPVSPDTVLAAMAMLRAVQAAAATASVLEMCLAYCNQREQFGRPLSKFQAIQHQLARLAGESSAATMAADMALRAFGQVIARPDDFRITAAAAKIRTAQAATQAAAIAHQVHGAIGFSGEYALHPLTRRLWSWRDEYGSEAYWAECLGREMAARDPAEFWPYLTSLDTVEEGRSA